MAMHQARNERKRPTRAETRARIVKAAGEVFAARGFDGASVDDVAMAAGLTKGAIYSSFASKDELFYALMQDRIGERLALVEAAVDREGTLLEMTRDAGAGVAELISSEGEWHLLFIEFWARAMRDPKLRRQFA